MPSSRPRVLVTRARHQASELADRLRALGAEPVVIPSIETVEPASFAALDAALARLDQFHWLIFTSANAVEAFARRLKVHDANAGDDDLTSDHSRAISEPAEHRVAHLLTASSSKGGVVPPMLQEADLPTLPEQLKIAVIGASTSRALEKIGLKPDLIPPQAIAESLTEALLARAHQPDDTPTRFLLIRAEEARELLPGTLRTAGAEVTIAPAYRTVIPPGSVALIQDLFRAELALTPQVPSTPTEPGSPSQEAVISTEAKRSGETRVFRSRADASLREPHEPSRNVDAITFTSSSSARNLTALCEAANVTLSPDALRISIGPITSQTLHELGLPPHAEAPEATVDSLAETVLKEWRSRSR